MGWLEGALRLFPAWEIRFDLWGWGHGYTIPSMFWPAVVLPGILTDTVDSLGKDVEDTKKKIELNKGEIAAAKSSPTATTPTSSRLRAKSATPSSTCSTTAA